jgi:hypothetical protein
MSEYLLELYVSRRGAHPPADDRDSARSAAEELTRRGTTVRFQHSIFVPAEPISVAKLTLTPAGAATSMAAKTIALRR